MQKSLSLGAKLIILVGVALLFGATMIALSVHPHRVERSESSSWDKNSKKFEKTFSVHPDGKLIIDADEGDMTITGSDSQAVIVRVTARGSDDQLGRLNVIFDQDGNTVKTVCRVKHRFLNFSVTESFNIHIDVQLPRAFNLNLQTSGGDIVVHDVKGTIQGETSGGNLDIADAEGNVKMGTSGGNVSLVHSTGEFALETSGGNMEGERVTGSIHMETSGGNIELRNIDGKLYASTSGGNIRVSMKDNKGIDLSSSGGNLLVRLPKSISADVQAESSGGDVNCDFSFNGKLREGSLNGTINGGGNLIKLETSGGDITITATE